MSNVDICNQALTFLGAERITSLTQNSENARRCNAIFEQTRNEVIRSHPWNFAVARVSLALLSTTPVDSSFSAEFQLPADCLKVLTITDQADPEFKIEGRKLLCDYSEVYIRYIKKVTDPVQFDDNFIEALAAKLAMKLAYPITESKTLAELSKELYDDILADARSIDAQEGTPEETIEGDWLDARSE